MCPEKFVRSAFYRLHLVSLKRIMKKNILAKIFKYVYFLYGTHTSYVKKMYKGLVQFVAEQSFFIKNSAVS